MIDIIATLPSALATGSDTPAPITLQGGGSAANTACWLSFLGAPAVFAGRVGDDPFGRDAVAALHSAGVRTRVSIDPTLPTGVCIVLIDPAGERTMIPSAGANGALTPADLTGLVGAEDHLHLSGYSLLNSGSRPAAVAMHRAGGGGRCRHLGGRSLGRSDQNGRRAQTCSTGYRPAACCSPTPRSWPRLPNGPTPAELTSRSLTVVVKDGPDGARIADQQRVRRIATEPAPVRDSTGAGDAFAAGLLAARWAGAELDTAVRQGNRVAARALGILGGRPRPE